MLACIWVPGVAADGHRLERRARPAVVVNGSGATRIVGAGAVRAGVIPHGRASTPIRRWGLAARGALVEGGGPALSVDWVDRDLVWADVAPRLYASAAAGQWDPATAVDWDAAVDVPPTRSKTPSCR